MGLLNRIKNSPWEGRGLLPWATQTGPEMKGVATMGQSNRAKNTCGQRECCQPFLGFNGKGTLQACLFFGFWPVSEMPSVLNVVP